MSDWSTPLAAGTSIMLSTGDMVGGQLAGQGLGSNTGTWPLANEAMFIPFRVFQPLTAYKLYIQNATGAGNLDMGIYDPGGNRLVSKGSTATGSSAVQALDITDTPLDPGLWYLGLAFDGNTSTMPAYGMTSAANRAGMVASLGIVKATSAFPLPSTVTFATNDFLFTPLVGIAFRTVV